jgi:S1-C subfamily serine protease
MNPNDTDPIAVTNEAPMIDDELPAVDIAKKPAPTGPRVVERIAGGLWNWVLPCMFLLSLFVLILYAAPYLLYHWRIMDAHADAEVIYTKRRAELKADAEHADQRLDVLDKRVHLISLGFQEVARKVLPVVVNVTNYREPTKKDLDLVEAREMALVYDPENDRKYVQHGSGSGLILKPGVILTNHHVVKKAKRLRVSFPSGRSIGIDLDAVVSDSRTDLAVIRLPDNLPAAMKEEAQNSAEFADSEKDVHVGEWVLAMGSPHGFRQTVTHGIISAKGRLLTTRDLDLVELLQTDAAMNPGNSGGPLFDQLGRVVGINTMIVSDTGGNQGLGFAIPSNTARRIADLLLTKGEVPRGYLGIAMDELPGPQAKTLKIDDGAVVVKAVLPGEPADKAGLKPGDIIVGVNKEALNRQKPIRHFRQMVADLEPGAAITLEIVRDEERRQIAATVGRRPANLP